MSRFPRKEDKKLRTADVYDWYQFLMICTGSRKKHKSGKNAIDKLNLHESFRMVAEEYETVAKSSSALADLHGVCIHATEPSFN